jgi:hypothetical protein
MQVKRKVIVPAILALSAAGSVLAGSTATLLATSAPVVATTAGAKAPGYVLHG